MNGQAALAAPYLPLKRRVLFLIGGRVAFHWLALSVPGAGLLELAAKAAKRHGSTSSNKWSLWRFLRFQKGDWVVAPMSRAFAVAEVIGPGGRRGCAAD